MKQDPLLDIDAALFTVGELALVAGIKRGLADVWVNRGVIPPTRVAHVSGRRRPLFSVRAIFKAKLVRMLGDYFAIGPTDSARLAKDSVSAQVADMLAGEDWMYAAVRNPHLDFSVAVARIDKRWHWKLVTKGDNIASYFGHGVPFIVLPIWAVFTTVFSDCKELHAGDSQETSDGAA